MEWVRERLGAERVSERRACRVLGQVRSTQRRERHSPDDEARLVAEMVELATRYGRYGYRTYYGDASVGGVEGESQEGGETVETGGAESPVQTAETKEAVAP